MTIGHRDFVVSAEDMLKTNTETGYRNAASRAYYGAFHACQMLRERLGIPIYANIDGGMHEKLIGSLESCGQYHRDTNKQVKRLGVLLRIVRTHRTSADYQLEKEFTEVTAQNALTQTKKIVDGAEQLMQENAA